MLVRARFTKVKFVLPTNQKSFKRFHRQVCHPYSVLVYCGRNNVFFFVCKHEKNLGQEARHILRVNTKKKNKVKNATLVVLNLIKVISNYRSPSDGASISINFLSQPFPE